VVIGRNQRENEAIEELAGTQDGKARGLGYPGPVALIIGQPDTPVWEKAAQLTAAYSDGPAGGALAVQLSRGDRVWTLQVPKLAKEAFKPWIL
jgi:hypothetical protein